MRRKHVTKKELKAMLRSTFEVPAPTGKEAFLGKYGKGRRCRPESGMAAFIMTQMTYIRKRVWLLYAGLFLAALSTGVFAEKNVLWIFSALTPFLAVSAVTESTRSANCGMAELELSACFSVRSVMFARMAIMGPLHILLLLCLTFAGRDGMYTAVEAGVYLVLPYMMTNVVCLWLTRKIRGQEGTYACMAAAILIAVLYDAAKYSGATMFDGRYLQWWLAAFALFTVLAVREYGKMVRQMEQVA